jgi:hypothetical protein
MICMTIIQIQQLKCFDVTISYPVHIYNVVLCDHLDLLKILINAHYINVTENNLILIIFSLNSFIEMF